MVGEHQSFQNLQPSPETQLTPRSALHDYNDALQACYDLPEQQQEFASIVADAIQATPIAEDREIVKVAAGILHWELFGEFGGPLPDGLVNSGAGIHYDDSLLAPGSYGPGHAALSGKRLNALSGLRVQQRKANVDKLYPYVEAVMRQSDKYRELQGYTLRSPDEIEDMPLSKEEYLVREAQIEGRARQKFGLRSGASFRLDGTAFKVVNNEKRILNVESERSSNIQESPFNILRNKIKQHIPEDLRQRYRAGDDVELHCVEYEDGKLIATFEQINLYGTGKSELGRAPVDISNVAASMGFAGSQALGREFEYTFLKQVISEVFKPGVDTPFYDRWLAKCASIASRSSDVKGVLLTSELKRQHIANARYRQTVAPVRHQIDNVKPRLRHSSLAEDVSRSSRQEMDEQKRKIIGNVWFAPHAIDRQRRVIQSRPRREAYEPFNAADADMIFTAAPDLFTDEEPFVLGYTLTGYDEDSRTYSFICDANGDPAVKQQVPIPKEGLTQLTAAYASVSLQKLAEDAGKNPALTLDDLERLIQKHSKYVFSKGKDSPSSIKDLQDFARFIDRGAGKLHVQCDGGNTFFKVSANLAFGRQVVRTISGYPIEGSSGVVYGMPHRQSVYEDEGRVVLHDATPYPNHIMRLIASRLQSQVAGKKPYYDNNRTAPAYIERQAAAVMERPVLTPEVRQSVGALVVRSQAERFENQLRDQFKVRDFEELFHKLQGQKSYPLLRTLLLVREAAEGSADLTALSAHKEFLINIQNATREERQLWGYANYDKMIGYLISTLQIIHASAAQR